MIRLAARSACHQGCELPQDGGPQAVDRAAAAHTKKTKHTTTVVAEPVQ